MFSAPPATTISASPVWIQRAAGVDSLEAGAANAVHGIGGHFDGQAGLYGSVPGDVAVFHDLPDAAKHDLVDLVPLDAGADHGFPDYGGGEVGSRRVGKATLEPADCGAHTANENNILHLNSLLRMDGRCQAC